ncbi:putative rRNA-processing protein PIN domain protein [Paratrimastix pyriformis]|uniref:rRNA-processing protein PIN domain protein n=1 Tax=Paratrimastix pyriformis TaxID=342808 RepID=A0ABQ8UBQ0_9EUKA|nr:putative rRNA-processing protein PIN domain protein [Paratrimastix pyriformis]
MLLGDGIDHPGRDGRCAQFVLRNVSCPNQFRQWGGLLRMRVHRLKRARKSLLFYKMGFGLKPPYYTLVDPSFLAFALTYKVDVQDQVTKLFDEHCTICVTPCFLNAIRQLPNADELQDVCRSFRTHYCGHPPGTSPRFCMLDLAEGLQRRFCVAVQDFATRELLRLIPGVPLLYCNLNCVVMELPSSQNEEFSRLLSVKRMSAAPTVAAPGDAAPVVLHRRKVVKGANPLSARKKKPQSAQKDRPKLVAN